MSLRILALLATLLVLTGCSAWTLSSLQGEYVDVVQKRSACAATAPAPSQKADLACATPDEPVLFDTARRADGEAREERNPLIAIALYRLSASAGWLSRSPGALVLAEDSGAKGRALCDTPANAAAAPRDCALLRVTPPFVAHATALNQLEAMDGKKAMPGTDERKTLDMLWASYLENTLRRVETMRATLDTKRVSPAIDTYLTSQRLAFVCTYQKIGQIYDESGERVISERIGETFANMRKEFALNAQCP